MSQINYAEAIEKEGQFSKGRRAWALASEEWREFGDIDIEHSTGVEVRLGDQPRLEKEVAQLRQKLDEMQPGLREELLAQKRAQLTDAERKAVDTPPSDRTMEQMELAYGATGKLKISDRDVAERIAQAQPERKKEVLKLVGELEHVDQELRFTIAYKTDSNFDYWKLRCDFEQTPAALQAREMLYLGKRAFEEEAALLKAKELYDQGFVAWREVIDTFPELLDQESTTGDDLMEYIKEYREILDQLDETLGDDFPLWAVVETFDTERIFAEELREYQRRQEGERPASEPQAGDEDEETSSEEAPSTSTDN